MKGTRLPERATPDWQYVCDRCGGLHEYHSKRRPDTCADCQAVERDVQFLALLDDGATIEDARRVAGIGREYARNLALFAYEDAS